MLAILLFVAVIAASVGVALAGEYLALRLLLRIMQRQ